MEGWEWRGGRDGGRGAWEGWGWRDGREEMGGAGGGMEEWEGLEGGMANKKQGMYFAACVNTVGGIQMSVFLMLYTELSREQ